MMPVAGIGASAGGLEAMLPMFANVQATGRIRYVVAQHMAKDGHDELVVRLIQRSSKLPVVLATNGVQMLADTVYVIPSGKDGQVQGDALHLGDPVPENISTPSVNVLLQSIAKNCRASGIGIVLSGTGSDGATGCRAIKAAGGITFAQDPQEAKFDGMPQAAIDSRAVDQVMPAQQIAAKLASLFPGNPVAGWSPPGAAAAAPFWQQMPQGDAKEQEPAQQELQGLLRQVRQATGIDFSSYKEDTLLRRLEKRKAAQGANSPDAYQSFIRRNPSELQALQQLFLVSVSSFFRDRASFDALQVVLLDLLKRKPAGEPIQVWVPGCASGEEAYTLAILLRELLNKQQLRQEFVVTGTDLNPNALETARAGRYRAPAFKEMDESLQARYFSRKGGDFEVSAEVRSLVDFEQRDVLTGPPKVLLDLVSCRNLLIYMKSPLQDRLIKSFYQALRPQALLFIGPSESLSSVGNTMFSPIDHYHRLFRRLH
jgi:chemotaxis protein methyltransferase CheR/two-component system CheB/CheR fusion protein